MPAFFISRTDSLFADTGSDFSISDLGFLNFTILPLVLASHLAATAQTGAPVVRPVDIVVDIHREGENGLELRSIAWDDERVTWQLRFCYTESGDSRQLQRLTVVGPGGERRAVHLAGLVYDIVNGVMLDVAPGSGQTTSLGIKRAFDHPFCRVWETRTWRVYRLFWHIGGLSGPPPVPMAVIAVDRTTGRWAAWATAIEEHAADGQDVQGIDSLAGDRVLIWWWDWVSSGTMRRRSWVVERSDGTPRFSDGPARFMLWTWNGSPRTFGATPQEARQLGRLEVAWRIVTTNPAGGVALARGDSPRQIDNSEDVADGLLVPHDGEQLEFRWQAWLCVVPARGYVYWVSAREARALAEKGGWDVVLYRHGHEVRAQWLVQSF